MAVALLQQMEDLLPNVLLVTAVIARSDLRLWDVESGKELVTLPVDDLVASPSSEIRDVDLAFSPDSRSLLVAGSKLRV